MGLNARGLAPVLLIALLLLVGFLGLGMTGAWDPMCLENNPAYGTPCWKEPVAPPRPGAPLPPPEGAGSTVAGASAGIPPVTDNAANNTMIDAAALRKALEQKIGGPGEAQAEVEKALARVQLQHPPAEVQADAAKWPWPKQVEIFLTENQADFTAQVPLFRAKPFTITGSDTPLYEWALPGMTDDGTAGAYAANPGSHPEVKFVADALNASQDPGYEAEDAKVPESYERARVAKPLVRVLPEETAAHYFSMQMKDPDNDQSQFGANPFVLEITPTKEDGLLRIQTFFTQMKDSYSPVMNLYALLTPKYGWGNEKTADYSDTLVVRFTLYFTPKDILEWMSQEKTNDGKPNPLKEVNDCMASLRRWEATDCLTKLNPAALATYRKLDAYRMQWSMTGGKPVDLWSYTYNRQDYPVGGTKFDSRIEVFSSQYPNKESQPAVWVLLSHPKSAKNKDGTYTPLDGSTRVNPEAATLNFVDGSGNGISAAADLTKVRNDVPWPRMADSLVPVANYAFPLPASLEAGKKYKLQLELGDKIIPLAIRDYPELKLDSIQPTAYTVTYAAPENN